MRLFKRLRYQCERRLGGIPVPVPFDLDEFAATVARSRGRKLRILPLPGLDGSDALSGAWVATPEADLILVDADASPWHRNLIALHEISHLLCDHRAGRRWPAEVTALLDGNGHSPIGHHAYTRAEEREAELMAGLILERAEDGPPPASAGGREAIAGRLAHALRHPVRRA